MLIILETKIVIKNPGDLKKCSKEEVFIIKKNERLGKTEFELPKKINNNKDRKIYKTGFLFTFLNELYPMKNYDDICDIMVERYHVFLEKRQVQRSAQLFNSNEFYIN